MTTPFVLAAFGLGVVVGALLIIEASLFQEGRRQWCEAGP
jgi:hypothetical protein